MAKKPKLYKPQKDVYLITRTSLHEYADPVTPPCTEAYKVLVQRIDVRTVDDPKKLNPSAQEDWYRRGTNHRVENGQIKRDLGLETKWAVKVPDLLAFVDKYGDCVIARGYDGYLGLEIYDDYRE